MPATAPKNKRTGRPRGKARANTEQFRALLTVPRTVAELAKTLRVTRQAVYARLATLGDAVRFEDGPDGRKFQLAPAPAALVLPDGRALPLRDLTSVAYANGKLAFVDGSGEHDVTLPAKA